MILLEPGYWHIHVRLGQLYMSSGRSDEAISEFSIAETLVPTEPNVINRLGAAHYYAGDFPRAAEFFERALQNNQTPSALSNSASVWFLAGDYERAATYYGSGQTWPTLNPKYPVARATPERITSYRCSWRKKIWR
jgi:Flp pilus assembly protein TadD